MCGKKTPIVFCTEPVFLIDCNFSNFLNALLENDDNINLFCILRGIYKYIDIYFILYFMFKFLLAFSFFSFPFITIWK